MNFSVHFYCLLLLFSNGNAFSNQGRPSVQKLPSSSDVSGAFKPTELRNSVACFAAPKKAPKKSTSTSPETFKKADFVAAIAERRGVTKIEAESSLQSVLEIIQEQVARGKKISLPGFGSFSLRDRSERKGRNPQTGEELIIPASKNPSFTASKTWKDAINGK